MRNEKEQTLRVIARIHTEYPQKFGIPRQSGMEAATEAEIVFEPPYRNPDAVRGLKDFSHIWVIWQFSKAQLKDKSWSPTVRPPRLGGNRRMGVFATRSPFRPNAIGLSSLRLKEIVYSEKLGPVLKVTGADMLDNTPIYDIKPYLKFTDCHPNAVCGFADEHRDDRLLVEFSEEAENTAAKEALTKLKNVLSMDPRPSYQDDPERLYKMTAMGYDISFTVNGGILKVEHLKPKEDSVDK